MSEPAELSAGRKPKPDRAGRTGTGEPGAEPSSAGSRVCKECPPGSKRPAPKPGPRCVTHDRAKRKRDRQKALEARLLARYGLTFEEYEKIKAEQGGKCAICQKATGETKALSVEEDHETWVIRGLACGPCNWLIERLGGAAGAQRVVDYFTDPPAVRALGGPKRSRRAG